MLSGFADVAIDQVSMLAMRWLSPTESRLTTKKCVTCNSQPLKRSPGASKKQTETEPDYKSEADWKHREADLSYVQEVS